MYHCVLFKSTALAKLFIKEQLKEPVALFWTVISPVVTYYLISYARLPVANGDYLLNASWFYAFISSSVAFFGLAFYIVGRRESGFLRSFVYTLNTKMVFLCGHCLAYSLVSVVYCSVFYIFTRYYSGFGGVVEFFIVVGRFYLCFFLFSALALLMTLIPLSFQNSSTLFSVVSLAMLALGIINMNISSPMLATVNLFNPMRWANLIMSGGMEHVGFVVFTIGASYVISVVLTFRFLLINPVWSRY